MAAAIAIISNHRKEFQAGYPGIGLGRPARLFMVRNNYFAETLVGTQIDSVLVDSEVTYIMLSNGTQVTIKGLVVVQPKPKASCARAAAAGQ